MKITSEKLFNAANGASSINSAAFSIEHLVDIGLTVAMAGTLSGNMVLQVSNDHTEDETAVAGWATLLTSPANLTFAGSASTLCLNYADCGFRWMRLAWTATGGAGTLTALLNAKGV